MLIDREGPSAAEHDSVLVDNYGGARAAIEYLISKGHDRIATIAGSTESTPGRLRLEGYHDALAAHGIGAANGLVQFGGFMQHGGYQAMMRLLAPPDPPTAVFVANNLMTIGALRALKDIGVQVPQDLSIIGFDDHIFADLIDPPLTVIDRPMEEQGALAMRILLSKLNGPPANRIRRVVLDTRLVERASCAPPRTRPMNTGYAPRGP